MNIKTIEKLYEKYNLYITLEEIKNLVCAFSKENGYGGLETNDFKKVINNLEKYNYYYNINYKTIYECLKKIHDRKEKLKSKNLSCSKINYEYIRIFCINDYEAKVHYKDYCNKKTKGLKDTDPKYKDAKSLNFHIRKYGKEEGTKIYNIKRQTIYKETSNCCVEWYLKRGYTEEEAKEAISERQSTFSYEKCIEKYGEEEGIRVWKERQDKWQKTLKSRRDYKEICNTRSPVKGLLITRGIEPKEVVEMLKDYKNYNKYYSLDILEFKNIMKRDRNKFPIMKYWDKRKLTNFYGQTQLDLLDINDSIFEDYFEMIKNLPFQPYLFFKSKAAFHAYNMRVDEGYLRSIYEINFYELLKNNNIEFYLDKCYPNSQLRYDFYLNDYDQYIEICPMYSDSGNEYDNNINFKKETFNAIILKDLEDQYNFIQSLF